MKGRDQLTQVRGWFVIGNTVLIAACLIATELIAIGRRYGAAVDFASDRWGSRPAGAGGRQGASAHDEGALRRRDLLELVVDCVAAAANCIRSYLRMDIPAARTAAAAAIV